MLPCPLFFTSLFFILPSKVTIPRNQGPFGTIFWVLQFRTSNRRFLALENYVLWHLSMMEIRCHPTLGHFGMKIEDCFQLKIIEKQQTAEKALYAPTFCLKAVHKFSFVMLSPPLSPTKKIRMTFNHWGWLPPAQRGTKRNLHDKLY